MKKSLLLGLSTLALIGTATVSHARMNDNSWYVGAGASWVASNFTDKFSFTTAAAESGPIQKIGLEDKSAFGGTFLAGYNFDFSGWNTFTEFSYGFDSSSSTADKRYDKEFTTFNHSLGRTHTLGLGVGVSKDINNSMAAYLKVSALYSKFDLSVKTSDIDDVAAPIIPGASSSKKWLWGWAPTVGISKELDGQFTIKADYSYQMYGTFKKGLTLTSEVTSDSHTKVSPRYHVVGITLTKAL